MLRRRRQLGFVILHIRVGERGVRLQIGFIGAHGLALAVHCRQTQILDGHDRVARMAAALRERVVGVAMPRAVLIHDALHVVFGLIVSAGEHGIASLAVEGCGRSGMQPHKKSYHRSERRSASQYYCKFAFHQYSPPLLGR